MKRFGARAHHAPPAEGEATKARKVQPALSPRDGPCGWREDAALFPARRRPPRPRRAGKLVWNKSRNPLIRGEFDSKRGPWGRGRPALARADRRAAQGGRNRHARSAPCGAWEGKMPSPQVLAPRSPSRCVAGVSSFRVRDSGVPSGVGTPKRTSHCAILPARWYGLDFEPKPWGIYMLEGRARLRYEGASCLEATLRRRLRSRPRRRNRLPGVRGRRVRCRRWGRRHRGGGRP